MLQQPKLITKLLTLCISLCAHSGSGGAGHGAPWSHALLTRFADQAQLRSFLSLPPCATLAGGQATAAAAGAPLYSALSASFDIGPMQVQSLP